jgi:hypothetical protein
MVKISIQLVFDCLNLLGFICKNKNKKNNLSDLIFIVFDYNTFSPHLRTHSLQMPTFFLCEI